MAVTPKVQERHVACVDCESRITLNGAVKLGQELRCPLCDAVMEIVALDPLEADWIYDEPEYEQDEEKEVDW